MIEITPFRTEGLGDSTYLLAAGDVAVLVDPQRDVDRFLAHLGDRQLRWVLETHLHNDYVSGGRGAAAATGAELVLPASAAPSFRHTPAFHQEELTAGPLTIRPLHTPGHTPEHTSYLVAFDGEARALFSGGSLLVGSSGRSDLLGDDRAETLARLQYRSVHRLAALPPDTGLYPTHGAGSFCVASPSAIDTSTVGAELGTNPALAHPDEEAFVAAHLAGLQPYPTYYHRMAPINLAGPEPWPDHSVTSVDPSAIDTMATVVDLRPGEAFAAGHLPGSINIPLSDQFGVWFGWIIPDGEAVYLVAAAEAEVDEAMTQLARIGIDSVAGAVFRPRATVTSRTGRISDIPSDAQILDVRSPGERAELAPPRTIHRYLPDLVAGPFPDLDPARPVWVVCAGGYRSVIAASLLRRHGFDAVPVLNGSVSDL